MFGGSLLFNGDNGCVFDKPGICATRNYTFRNRHNRSNTTRKFYKIIRKEGESYKNELDNSLLFSKIPDYQDYFVLIEDVCEMNERPEGWEQCRLFRLGLQTVPFLQVKMNYAGEILSRYMAQRERLYKNWLRIQVNVAEALKQLHVRGWVHGDLHYGNIVIDGLDRARIIDFGMSYNINRIKDSDINLSFLPEYDNYAPELDYVAGLNSELDPNNVINQIYTKKRVLDKINDVFPSAEGVLGELQIFAKFHEPPLDAKKFINAYAKPSDIWTLGYDFYTIYMDMLSDQRMISSEFYRKNHRNQMLLLKGMLQVDPRFRFTIDQVLTALYTMRIGI
jgi:serine/threonine protein kinase